MVRRTLLIGMVLVVQLAAGCCWKCGHVREKPLRIKHHSAAVMGEPCGCSGASPIPIYTSAPVGEPPLVRAEPLPPKLLTTSPPSVRATTVSNPR